VFNKVFRDKIVLNVTVSPSGDKEFGESMKTPKNQMYALDLSNVKWYAYNDNYGTSEEKALVKYIEGKMDKFEEKYDEIYLVRNEKDLKIYDFAEGRPFEPDFVLFLRIKGAPDKYDNLQLFIEPKGDNLLVKDKWKNDFLKQIKAMAEVTWCTNTDDYMVWGIPFFNENSNAEFMAAMDNEVLEYVADSAEDVYKIVSLSEVPEGKCYVDYLPVYSIKAACGYFEDNCIIPENEAEGWIDISNYHIRGGKDNFVIRAIGNSMLPKIKDGAFCVFKLYNVDSGGTRDGDIVLTECPDKDTDTDCHYTIKKYHSEILEHSDGTREHSKIELIPLNKDYDVIELNNDIEYRTIGVLISVLD
jgi:SOS-response transcriptional repressor LexA